MGDYEYISAGKNNQQLSLNADKSISYTEHTETAMETQDSVGRGTWCIRKHTTGLFVDVRLEELRKEMKFKVKPLVPGIGDGVHVESNVMIPIEIEKLQAKAKFGAHKWRVRAK